MNERIKQLAEQAFAVCGKHSNNYNGPAFSAKFAELIVKECIKSIRPYDASGHFEETIREHFYGVNE